VGILLLIGVFGRRKERLVVLDHDTQAGVVAARRRPLGDMARALAEPAPGAASIKRPRFSLSRRGARGTLKLNATRTRTTDPRELQAAVEETVQPITEPFNLRFRVRIRLGDSEGRVQ
jgi:hypothetical protein